MDKYTVYNEIGKGTYGVVYLAYDQLHNRPVAIKRLFQRVDSIEQCKAMREVQILSECKHPNIIQLYEIIKETNNCFFIFEYIPENLLEYQNQLSCPLTVDYLHQHNYIHRDIKPENILIYKYKIKLCDFGLTRSIYSRPPYTDYISTRWYRAPELLLKSIVYSTSVDIWAIGCVFVELLQQKPFLPGENEMDQLYKITAVLGSPKKGIWDQGEELANNLHFSFPDFECTFQEVFKQYPSEIQDLLRHIFIWNPQERYTTYELLRHSFFKECYSE
ncbi:hypothetical protein WA158_006319 [Blastocystis sp. Blastoise]